MLIYGAAPRIDLKDWALRAALPEVAESLAEVGVGDGYRLLGTNSLSRPALEAAAGNAWATRDSRPEVSLLPASALPEELVGDPFELLGLLSDEARWSPDRLDALPGLREAVDGVSAAREAGALVNMTPAAWRELIYGSALQPALHALPGDPALMDMLGLGPESPETDGWNAARRAYYEGRYEDALGALEALEPAGEEIALRWLLTGGCHRALGRTERAAEAFKSAADTTDHAKLRELLTVMSARADTPWPEAGGPLAGPQ